MSLYAYRFLKNFIPCTISEVEMSLFFEEFEEVEMSLYAYRPLKKIQVRLALLNRVVKISLYFYQPLKDLRHIM